METATMNIEAKRPNKKPYTVEFGKRFSAALEARGLIRSEAARLAGVNPGRITEYVTGARLVPLDTLDRIMTRLDLDPRILFPEWFERVLIAPAFRAKLAERSRTVREDLAIVDDRLADEPVESGRF